MLDADRDDVFAWRLDALERIVRREGPSRTTGRAFLDACGAFFGPSSGACEALRRVIDRSEGVADPTGVPSTAGGLLLPGCVSFLWVSPEEDGSAGAAHLDLLMVGEVVPTPVGPHEEARVRRQPPTSLSGLYVPGDGPVASRDWLVREGFLPLRSSRALAAAYPQPELYGHSASLALALALIGCGVGRGVASKWVPSAALRHDGARWRLVGVDAVKEKLDAAPREAGCTLILSRDNEGDVEPSRRRDVVFCDDLDAAVDVVFPGLTASDAELARNIDSPRLHRHRVGVTAALALIVTEVGLLQEFAPPSNWPGGVHPGWLSREALCATLGTGGCAALVALATWAWSHRLLRSPIRSAAAFYGEGVALWLTLCVVCGAVLTRTVTPPGTAGTTRDAGFQIVKAIGFEGLAAVTVSLPTIQVMVWAALHAKAGRWLAVRRLTRRWCPYPGHVHICRTGYQGVMYCGMVLAVVFSLQWLSWKNPHEPGFGDTWRGAHMLAQAALFMVLAVLQWSGLRHVETLHRHRRERAILRRNRHETPRGRPHVA